MDTDSDDVSKPKDIYEQVVDNLKKHIVPEPTRKQLRDAVDIADTGPVGRDKSDDALKRITR